MYKPSIRFGDFMCTGYPGGLLTAYNSETNNMNSYFV
jgi:hypothetical protein